MKNEIINVANKNPTEIRYAPKYIFVFFININPEKNIADEKSPKSNKEIEDDTVTTPKSKNIMIQMNAPGIITES